MLEVGAAAPSFALFSQDGNIVPLWRLVEQHRRTVVFFFLQAGAPGCTKEAVGFRDLLGELKAREVGVVGISTEPAQALAEFAAANRLEFPLLSDPDHTICDEWGAWRGQGVGRVSYILDDSGRVTHVFPRVDVNRHAADVLALFSDAATPAAATPTAAPEISSPAVQAAPADELGAAIVAAGRATLALLVAHVDAGHALPDDVRELAARLSRR